MSGLDVYPEQNGWEECGQFRKVLLTGKAEVWTKTENYNHLFLRLCQTSDLRHRYIFLPERLDITNWQQISLYWLLTGGRGAAL